ncbi:hypothetical protein, partial [Bradyrhizobium sp. SZCCHNR3012]|uniref:hypothetical protein n=1 Tax=Bradyrhizobium sp. SZCCHNR3012 TaxID=3057392 RepID=UPI0028EFEA29
MRNIAARSHRLRRALQMSGVAARRSYYSVDRRNSGAPSDLLSDGAALLALTGSGFIASDLIGSILLLSTRGVSTRAVTCELS